MALTDLSRIGVVLLPRRSRSAWVGSCAALIVAALAGAAAHQMHGRLQTGPSPSPSNRAEALNEVQRLQQLMERTSLQARVAEARGLELERQIDILNQRLHASQEEVTFFRKAVNGKR